MFHHQLVRSQLLDECWHIYHLIQKYRLTMAREGHGGLPIQIPSKYPQVKGALRERRPKPSSVPCSCCLPFLTGVIICNNIWGAVQVFCAFTSPSSFTYRSLLQHVLHSGWKKFLACSGCPFAQWKQEQTLPYLKHMYGTNSPLDIRTDSSDVCRDGVVVAIEVHWNGQAFAKLDWGCASITSLVYYLAFLKHFRKSNLTYESVDVEDAEM